MNVSNQSNVWALQVRRLAACFGTSRPCGKTRARRSITHETAHKLNYPDKMINYVDNPNGQDEPINIKSKINKEGEAGYKFEDKVWGYPGGYESSKDFGASDKYQSGTTEGVIKNAEKSSEGRETIPTIPTK